MKEQTAKLAITVTMREGSEKAECNAELRGSLNGLMNAYEQLTAHLFSSVIDSIGKDAALGVYAFVQQRALQKLGVDLNEENKKLERRINAAEAFKDIIGKTFTVDDIGGEEDE